MSQAAASQWNPTAAKELAEALMKRYTIASEHTTLLLLHEAVQFVDNDLPCPESHPAHAEWRRLAAVKETQKASQDAQKVAEIQTKLDGMIGGFVKKFNGLLEYKAANPTVRPQAIKKIYDRTFVSEIAWL